MPPVSVRRFLAAGTAVSLAIVLAGCGSGASASTAPSGPLTVGASATVQASGGSSGTVDVVSYATNPRCANSLTPPSGDQIVGVSVSYDWTSGLVEFGPSDWTASSTDGTLKPVQGCYTDVLPAGVLQSGKTAKGWVVFEVPTSASHLQAVYRAPSGPGATWQLY